MRVFRASAFAFLIVGCSNPKSAVLPTNVKDLSQIQPQLQKLDSADRTMLAAYFMRHTMGTLFGASPIPQGTTIGQAIEEERKIDQDNAAKEKEQLRIAAQNEAGRVAAERVMDAAVTVALAKIGLNSGDEYGIGKSIDIRLVFQNKTAKQIAGIKGIAVFQDIFGDTINKLRVSYDEGVPASSTASWDGSRDYNQFMAEDVKLGHTPLEKIRFSFIPSTIVFADGTKLAQPEGD